VTGLRRTRWGRSAIALAAASLLVALAGCTAEEPEAPPTPEPEPEPTSIVVGTVGELTSFNPGTAQGATAANRTVNDFLHESFAYLDDSLQVVGNGGFGEVERISADPLVVQYKLFPDRKWSDGTAVTLDDLLFGWAVHSGWFDDAVYSDDGTLVSGTRYFDVAASTDGIRETARPEIDRAERTITLTYDAPFADWNREWLLDRPVRTVAELAGVSVADLMEAIRETPRGVPAMPVPPNPVLLAAAEAWNTGFDVDPAAGPDLATAVSNGPFRAESYADGELVLSHNPAYEGNHNPQYDLLIVRFYPDEEALQAAAIAGEVDVANLGDASAAEVERLREADLRVMTGPRPQTLDLLFAEDSPVMDDTVREAFLRSLDRERIVAESVRGVNPDAAPLRSFLSSAASGDTYAEIIADNGSPGGGADVAGALELLDGETPTVRIRYEPTDVLSADLFAEIAGMAARAGITVRPAGDGELADAQLVAADVSGTPYQAARERVVAGAGGVDALTAIREMRERTDPEEVAAMAREVDRALFDHLYGMPLVERAGVVVASPRVEGVGYTSAPTSTPRYFWTWTPAPQ
jgi:peptide/nickel transport system substrate-binding protein